MPSQSQVKLKLPASLSGGRFGRIALLVGVCLFIAFYLSSAVKLVSAHFDRVDTANQVQKLQKERDRLVAERRSLTGQQGVATEARRLGMVMPGEIPYVVTGLPGDRR